MKLKSRVMGKHHFNGTVDIADPGIIDDMYYETTVEVVDSDYVCIVWEDKCNIPRAIGIYAKGLIPKRKNMTESCYVGIDAGLAGFFEKKPEFSDFKGFSKFWKDVESKETAWKGYKGFFCKSGGVIGEYPVYGMKNNKGKYVALEIHFF